MKLLGPFFSARFGRLAICFICFATFFLARNTLGQYIAHRPASGAHALPLTAKGTPRTGKTLPAQGRFLGWKYAQRAGAAYFRRFARPRHGLAIPVQRSSSTSGSISKAATMLSASSPAPPRLPGFLFRPTLPAGFLPTSVATGDFNGDGRLDWVVANGGDNNLWLYLGNGDGTSQMPTIIPLSGQSPIVVEAADLRGNGILDLIVAEADSDTVGVLLGNGDGTFGAETEYPIPSPLTCMLVKDFNGDGHPDILVGMEGTQQTGVLALLPGNGDGTFGGPVITPGPSNVSNPAVMAIAAADLNGDKLPDVAAYGGMPETGIWIFLNHGDGTFSQPQSMAAEPYYGTPTLPRFPTNLALGDLNGDGCADLVVLDTWDLADRFLGNCDGTFQGPSSYQAFGIGEIGYGIALADVNGDGRPDIVSSGFVAGFPQAYGGQSGRLVSILLGDGQGNFSPPTVYRGEPGMYSLAVADLKGDGYPDIITANQDTDSVSVYANDGHGGFGPPQGGYVGYYVNGVSLAAVNAPLARPPMFADVNGDGKRDISILEAPQPNDSCNTCNVIGVVLNQGNGIFDQVIHSDILSTASSTVISQALANFRNTGLPDLLTTGTDFSTGGPYLSFAPNAGGGKFGTATVISPAGVNGPIGVGDFNRDGKLDFVAVSQVTGIAANTNGSLLSVFLGNGSGGFTPGYSAEFNLNSTLYPGKVFVGDFNGDGKLDVLVQETSTLEGTLGHNVYEFLGNGDGTFAAPVVVLTNSGPLTMGDLNHDGLPDFVEQVLPLTTNPSQTPPEYEIYLCQPDGSFKLAHTYEPYAGWTVNYGGGPFLRDFNGDGNLDILAYQSGGGTADPNGVKAYFQIMAGNGDGSFTPTYTIFDVTGDSSPQYAADVTGNGRADLVEIDGLTSSYHVVPATPGPAMQVRLVSDPVVGSDGSVQLSLAVASSSSTTVNLAASDSAITIPSSVTIPAGSVSLDVPFQIGAGFNPRHVFSIQAQLGTETETAYGTQASHSLGLGLNLQYTSMTVAAGGTTANYNLGVYSMSGYSTNVQLQCSGLPAGATCIFGSAAFALASGGFRFTSLTVATSSSLAAGTYSFSVVATGGTVTGQTSATLVIQQAPVLEVSPNSLNFPIQTIGTTSAPQTVTLTNVGSATMTLSILTSVTDPNNPDFSETNNCGGSLAVGAGCTVNVVFTPTTTGSAGGALEIGANLLGVKTTWVNLSGTAQGPLVQPSPGSLYFGDEYVGAPSAAKTVTLWNVGTVPLSFSSITVTGADPGDFAVAASGTNCSTSAQLDVGLGCVVNVTFDPTATGTRTATLSIAYNNSSTPQTVSLSGNGRSPDFTVAPAPGSPSSVTVTAGESATYTIAVTPLGAFTQPISIVCPGESTMTCSLSPASVTLNGTPQDVTVKIGTTAGALAAPRGPGPMNKPPVALWTGLLTLMGLAILVLTARSRAAGRTMLSDSSGRSGRLRARYALTLGAIMLTVVLWASCGGGNGASTASTAPMGTAAGNYSLLIYGYSGNLNHSTTVTLTVK